MISKKQFNNFILPVIYLFISFSLCVYSFADSDDIVEKQIDQQDQEITVNTRQESSRASEDLDLQIFMDLQQGYDNNVELSSSRLKDGFLQGSATVELDYTKPESLKWKIGTDVFETVYYNRNTNNLLDISPFVGFDWEITPNLISKNKIMFDYFVYPNNKESTFSALIASTYLRHYIQKVLYHEIGYEYSYRWYLKRKINLENAAEGTDEREDERSRIRYNIGYFASDKLFLKLMNEVSINDSNDKYQNYYDYWYYRVKPSLMYFFSDALYTNLSYSYKFTKYTDRRSTEDSSKEVNEGTHMGNVAVYYDVNKNLTFGITYSYSENVSNDPFQEYSGSVIYGGIYYTY